MGSTFDSDQTLAPLEWRHDPEPDADGLFEATQLWPYVHLWAGAAPRGSMGMMATGVAVTSSSSEVSDSCTTLTSAGLSA